MHIVLWDEGEIGSINERCVLRLYIRDRGVMVKLIMHLDLRYGELYTSGRIETEGNLAACLETVYRKIPGCSYRNFLTRMLARVCFH